MAGRFWGCAGMGCPCLDEEINCPSVAVSSTCAFFLKKKKSIHWGILVLGCGYECDVAEGKAMPKV